MEKKFTYKSFELAYSLIGTGPETLIAFHGFGQTKAHFKPFEQSLGSRYSIYTIDLFFHGGSVWNHQERVLSKELWKDMIHAFLINHKIATFSIAGYSMGGKFALAMLEEFPGRIEKMILIAPDGVTTNFWYKMATYPSSMRKLFKASINNPLLFERVVSVAKRLGLVDKGILKFAQTQMDTEEKRYRVYYSWIVFRKLKFKVNRLADVFNLYKIPLDVFLGKYDKMITQKHLKRLLKKVNHYHLEILDTGHNQLIREVADYYSKKTQP